MSGTTEELTTVQATAEEFTEVATKTSELLSTYNIQQSDIEGYQVAPFGQNKFLISIIYMFRTLGGWATGVGLKAPVLSRLFKAIKKQVNSVALKVSAIVTLFKFSRTIESIIALKIAAMGTLMEISRKMETSAALLASDIILLYTKSAFRTNLGTIVLSMERGKHTANRIMPSLISLSATVTEFYDKHSNIEPLSATAGIKAVSMDAWYNGVPIEV